MLKACLIGAAVTFALIAVPVVHFITAIPSAFIGGYLAGSKAEATAGQAFLIAVVMAALLVGPIFGAFMVSELLFGLGIGFVAAVTGLLSFWVILTGSLGAVIGGHSVRKQQLADS
jgi:hypothetical protein